MPQHVAMIIDGNRRWARHRELETAAHGHRAGAEKMREFLEWCDDLGIQVVTLYLLSTDNLRNRRTDELEQLFEIIADLAEDLSHTRDWRVQHVGTLDGLPDRFARSCSPPRSARRTTPGCTSISRSATAAGARSRMRCAASSSAREERRHARLARRDPHPRTDRRAPLHRGQPDPDLVIRTSGEQRLSDFMLWQSAHSEFYFVEALGPDLREVDFLRALRDYSRRQRRFGQ